MRVVEFAVAELRWSSGKACVTNDSGCEAVNSLTKRDSQLFLSLAALRAMELSGGNSKVLERWISARVRLGNDCNELKKETEPPGR